MRVFVDTSVIIAALLSPTGGSSIIISAIRAGKIHGITSETVVEEALQKTLQKKIKQSENKIKTFILQSGLLIREGATELDIKPYQNRIDIKDAHLIVGALGTKCSHLVTLDKKHLLNSTIKKRFLPLQIVSPKELLERVLGGTQFTVKKSRHTEK